MDNGHLGGEFGDESPEPNDESEADRLRKLIESGSINPPAPKAASTRDAAKLNADRIERSSDPGNRAMETLDQIESELDVERRIAAEQPRDST